MKKINNALFGFLALLFVCTAVSSHFENVNPIHVAIGITAVAFVSAQVFAVKREANAAYTAIITNIFDMSQIQLKEFVKAAIYQHFGYVQSPNGDWRPGKNAKKIPVGVLPEALRIKRNDIHHIQYLTPTEREFKFFDRVASTDGFTNMTGTALEGVKMQVIFGIQHEVATGAAAADTLDLLSFGAAADGDDEFINSTIEWEINKEKQLEPQQYKSLFVNDDGIKNYLRLPAPVIWEPNNSQIYRQKLSKAYAAGTHKFAKVTLIGFELSA